MKNTENHSEQQAIAQLESIREKVAFLTESIREEFRVDDAIAAIHEDPLSVEVRSGWYEPGTDKAEAEEYNILLCTGGPAVRIIGTLDAGEPHSARLEHQDWGTPWTEYRLTLEDEEIVLTYARQFYFGE